VPFPAIHCKSSVASRLAGFSFLSGAQGLKIFSPYGFVETKIPATIHCGFISQEPENFIDN